jgi:hypothetical protein
VHINPNWLARESLGERWYYAILESERA